MITLLLQKQLLFTNLYNLAKIQIYLRKYQTYNYGFTILYDKFR